MIYQNQHIDTIVFDLGGVILNIDYQLPVKAFKALGIEDFSKHFSQATQTTLLDDYETGRISSEVFIEEVSKFVKPGSTEDQIRAAWNSILLDLPEQRLFCLEKAAENHRIFLLSNTNEIHIEAFNHYLLQIYSLPSLEPFFEKLYLSYEVGLRKPDKQIFEHVLADAGLKPESTLFIDDSIQHIQTAAELGINTYHLTKEDICEFLEDKM
ncbi:MAG: HAD family hydrolase [Bacteroidia bacterium]|jgi:FMN phosphatase YigB (HAD superfamily)